MKTITDSRTNGLEHFDFIDDRNCAGWYNNQPAQFFCNRFCIMILVLLGSLVGPSPAFAQQPRVTITGGADEAGTMYHWTVTNHHTSPVIYVEFPHYRATIFFAPNGWSTDQSTHLVTAGHTVQPGLCVAHVQSGVVGIGSQRNADFRMQISPGEVQRVSGKVTLQFADGSKIVVRGVELPQRQALGDRYISLIGLGCIFILIIVIRTLKEKRRKVTHA